mgnify:FL=1
MDFKQKLNEFDIKINDEQIKSFEKYMNLLLEWNEKINLTAITQPEEIKLKHFVDSLTVLKYINEDDKVIDIGTGAGFPGIPLKIMNKNTKITLLDSLNKRINFLNIVIEKLDLSNIQAIHGRAEEIARNKLYREKYDVAVSRAVANLSTLTEYMLPFVKIGGKCICMKGANVNEELERAQNAIKELGGEIERVDNFYLSDNDNERNIIVIKKIKKTKSKYPRKAGTPSKEPL